MLQPLLTLHSQELLLCGPTRVHLRCGLRDRKRGRECEGGKVCGKKEEERGENDSIRAKSRLRLIPAPQGVKLYLEGDGEAQSEYIKEERDKLRRDQRIQ